MLFILSFTYLDSIGSGSHTCIALRVLYYSYPSIAFQIVLVLTSKEQQQQASASATVEEAITAIRTVVAFGGEAVEANRRVRCM